MSTPQCDYCGHGATLTNGAALYPRRPALARQHFYACVPCGAWVGCHDGTTVPLGRLANARLRRARSEAHQAFDPIWKIEMEAARCSKRIARDRAYAWLAVELKIPVADCHFGAFDEHLCRLATQLCNARLSPQSKLAAETHPCT